MKYKGIAILIFCVSLAATVLAQSGDDEEIGGAGTPGFLARFTGAHQIGNSPVFQAPDGSIGIGTTTPVWPLHVFSTKTTGANGSSPTAMLAESTAPHGVGVQAVESSSIGGIALVANAFSALNGVGVYGISGGNGVIGVATTPDAFTVGTLGDSEGKSGPGVGIFGQAWSLQGIAGLFINRPGGDILHGAVSQNPDITVFRVDGTGRVFADGGFQPNGADFAESMSVTGDRAKYAAGDLLVIDPTASRRVALAHQPYSTLVAGIYSTKPGMLGTTRKMDETAPSEIPLAVVGIVPCKVTAENGPIQIGDLLVTSSKPGYAMRGTDRNRMLGAVVGKALEPLPEGKGVIQVLVTLQ